MALRYEAYTTPWDPGGFKRKIAMLPTIDGTGRGSKGFLSFPGDSSVDLSLANFDRFDELVSDTESSLITVFDCDHDGTNKIIDEWILDRVPSDLQETREVSLTGGGLLSAFEKALVYAFDYPKSPAQQGDWVWGGGNILSNPDFETVNSSPKQVELVVTATGGTYTITAAGDTTSAIAFDAGASVVEDRLQLDIGAINDIIVVQTSNSPRTFLIEQVDPLFGTIFIVNTGSLTGGMATMTALDDGGNEITSWTRAATLAQGVQQQGSYDTWALSSTQNHTPGGQFSLFIDPGFLNATSNRNGGAQQVVNVTPGQVYQVSLWVRPTQSTILLRLGLFGIGEEVIALSSNRGESFIADTWNQLTIPDVVIPDGINRVIFRVACTNTGPANPGGFFLDDGAMLEGLVPTSIGDIWQTLLDDCAVDHAADPRGTVLEWVDYSSFDAVNDSNGTPWNHDDLSFVARWGSNMIHVLDDTYNRGYEAELVRKAAPVGGKTHDFKLYNPGGRDDDPSTAIHTGQPLTGGKGLFRNPAYTAVLVVGENGEYTEDTDPSLADFGRLETFLRDSEASEILSRQLLADNLFLFENANRKAISFNVVEALGVPRPFADYRLGDTIPMTMAPTLAKENRRVQRIDYVNSYPTQYVVVGSRVLQGEAAAFDLVGRMWRRLNRPGKFTPKSADPLPGGGGGAPTIVIAASDASDFSKSKADFICTGVNDEIIIQRALDSIDTGTGLGGRVLLTEGTFHCVYGVIRLADLTAQSPIHLQGVGKATLLSFESGTGIAIEMNSEDSTVSDLWLLGNDVVGVGGIEMGRSGQLVTGVKIERLGSGGSAIDITTQATNAIVSNNLIEDNSGDGITVSSVEHVIIDGNAILDTNGAGIALGVSVIDTTITTNSFTGTGTAITLAGNNDKTTITGNSFNMVNDAIVISGFNQNMISIVGNVIDADHCVFANSAVLARCTIADNSLNGGAGTTQHAISLIANSAINRITDIIISGNTTTFGGGSGIYLENCDRVTAIGNSIFHPDGHGIRLNNSSHNNIQANVVFGAGQDTDNTFDGIHLEGDSDKNILKGNKVASDPSALQATRYGINISAATCDGNALIHNDLRPSADFGTGDINNLGTGTLEHGNINDSGIGGEVGGGAAGSNTSTFSQAGALSVGTGTFKLPFTLAAEIVSIQLAVATSPTGADLIVDVNKNGTTVFTTQANRPTVPDGDANGVGAEAVPDVTSIAEGDYLSVDIDQVGSTVSGEDLTVVIEWRPA